MQTALFSHPACLEHDTGDHPECADRLRTIHKALEDEAFHMLVREEAPRATEAQLCRVHPADYVAAMLGVCPTEPDHLVHIDDVTVVSAGSREAMLRAAGAAVAAVDAVMEGWARAAFAAVRPPGHHAGPAEAGGFCLFNNAAVAALHARTRWGVDRVAVVDFDVHHGQGTQAVFAHDPTLFYASSHQFPLYPGTGFPDERGTADNIRNVILDPGADSHAFRTAWRDSLLPALEAFAPGLIIISAGFDAHARDPLAHLRLRADDYAWITAELVAIAGRHSDRRIVSTLEGGYDLVGLAESVAVHVRGLMEA